MYRIGFPGWKWAARFGVPLFLTVNVIRDNQAGVYVATSPDLKGLVAEGKSKEDVITAVYDCTDLLLEHELHHQPKKKTFAAWTGEVLAA
jgi:predicted RNase H-like HicB family nuclease